MSASGCSRTVVVVPPAPENTRAMPMTFSVDAKPSSLRPLLARSVAVACAFAFTTACGGPSDAATAPPASDMAAATGPASTDAPAVPQDPQVPQGAVATLASASTPATTPYRGVNLAGGEFGDALPGQENVDYTWPTSSEVDYYLSKGMNTFRVGFKWERLQPTANGELVAAYLAKLDGLVTYITAHGARAILNPHNFARYYGSLVGSAQVPDAVFADLWRRLATRYGSNERVIFNLVNEPNTMPTEQWVSAANAAIAAIRGAGATNELHVPGNGWTGAHSWTSSSYGTPNSIAMLDIVDPGNHMVYEVHQYLDTDAGGTSDQCVSTTIGSERLQAFVDWLRVHGKKGFVGEFAGGDNPTCNAAVADMLTAMSGASDVLEGWLWWAAGPWWGNYPFSLEPKNGQDQPQMKLLLPHLVS
jgi:endoglucanase